MEWPCTVCRLRISPLGEEAQTHRLGLTPSLEADLLPLHPCRETWGRQDPLGRKDPLDPGDSPVPKELQETW